MAQDQDPVDLLVVGAGLHGLTMAKTYLQVHPSAKLVIVDEASSLGGTWARERLYPGLKTNNVFGSYELSDYPMVPERYGVEGKGTGHIPGEVVHAYLCDVAGHFRLTERVRLGTRVVDAMIEKEVWEVKTESRSAGSQRVEKIYAKKLVIATGLTSTPYIPHIPGSRAFGGLILHSKQLREQAQALAQCKRVVVVGGNKSAWDVCYTAAKAGAQVDMVIRPSGGGPSYLWPRQFSLGPFKISLAKLSLIRLFTLFDPAPAPYPLTPSPSRPSWVKRFLHRARLGQWITHLFWSYLDYIIRKMNGYNSHPDLKKLEPWTTPFWMGNSLSIHNYETSWFDLVRAGRIRVHIAELEELSEGRVHLGNGDVLGADALVLCTGWRCDIPVQLQADAGEQPELEEDDSVLTKEALETIHEDVPYLRTLPRRTPNAPTYHEHSVSREKENESAFPLLCRDILPVQRQFIERRNLAFIGMSVSIHAVLVAQAQALWITALFSDRIAHLHLPLDHDNDIKKSNLDTDMYTAVRSMAIRDRVYGEVRRPRETGGLGGQHQDLVFDSLPYVDGLLGDLGVETRRNGSGLRGWWREWTEAYRPADYEGVVGEWMALQGIGEDEEEQDGLEEL
ncbi:flavin-containing monooxygenase [Aspergillus mulundensis]|uniref:FAD/NAD(P)-binding domain-containing protein n=1 Tax=Aspergillus mulundensis TaxID=1810919 RepID=A0A3D8QS78_9EURO|nr:hypothetical protein DSM5745_09939 [Aspergillus mulundensis]RDW64528.1 hypothetical protein DSM5745_09939 [Aspergillus mulundensis]